MDGRPESTIHIRPDGGCSAFLLLNELARKFGHRGNDVNVEERIAKLGEYRRVVQRFMQSKARDLVRSAWLWLRHLLQSIVQKLRSANSSYNTFMDRRIERLLTIDGDTSTATWRDLGLRFHADLKSLPGEAWIFAGTVVTAFSFLNFLGFNPSSAPIHYLAQNWQRLSEAVWSTVLGPLQIRLHPVWQHAFTLQLLFASLYSRGLSLTRKGSTAIFDLKFAKYHNLYMAFLWLFLSVGAGIWVGLNTPPSNPPHAISDALLLVGVGGLAACIVFCCYFPYHAFVYRSKFMNFVRGAIAKNLLGALLVTTASIAFMALAIFLNQRLETGIELLAPLRYLLAATAIIVYGGIWLTIALSAISIPRVFIAFMLNVCAVVVLDLVLP
jgi:hypothetical protein